jgi:hypothetical protein
MSKTYEVLSAFLDDEPFDPQALDEALSEPAGRALLIDLMALRRVVQPKDAAPTIHRPSARRTPWRFSVAAAALLLALAGGYLAGVQRAMTTPVQTAAPPPNRVVQAVPFVPAGGPQ